MMTVYIYYSMGQRGRSGRLSVSINAVGHIIGHDGKLACGRPVPEHYRRLTRPMPGRRVCPDCKAEFTAAPSPKSKAGRRQVELEKWQRLTGERPPVK